LEYGVFSSFTALNIFFYDELYIFRKDRKKRLKVPRVLMSMTANRLNTLPYRIQHRGYWFYVDDSELEAKMFFEALVAAYSSRVGSKEAGDEKPQIVLPLGGG
jgi:hypothetical protein